MGSQYTVDWTHNLATSIRILYPDPPLHSLKCVEIGSFEGRGSVLIHNYLCSNSESTLMCIDPFDDEYIKGDTRFDSCNHFCNGQYSRFLKNTCQYKTINSMKGTSTVCIPLLADKSIDFAYIDGNHTAEQVYIDAVLMFQKMKQGGIILFDDYLFTLNDIVTKDGIDTFLNEYTGRYELLFKNYQLALRVL